MILTGINDCIIDISHAVLISGERLVRVLEVFTKNVWVPQALQWDKSNWEIIKYFFCVD